MVELDDSTRRSVVRQAVDGIELLSSLKLNQSKACYWSIVRVGMPESDVIYKVGKAYRWVPALVEPAHAGRLNCCLHIGPA